jgi:hypothetical protein
MSFSTDQATNKAKCTHKIYPFRSWNQPQNIKFQKHSSSLYRHEKPYTLPDLSPVLLPLPILMHKDTLRRVETHLTAPSKRLAVCFQNQGSLEMISVATPLDVFVSLIAAPQITM